MNEPLQFYSGKDSQLFEIVINSINSKNQVGGYLSVPKSAPFRLLFHNRVRGASTSWADTGTRR